MEESEQCCLELYTLNNSIDEYINIMSYLNTHTHTQTKTGSTYCHRLVFLKVNVSNYKQDKEESRQGAASLHVYY